MFMILKTKITMNKSEEIASPIELHTLKSGYQAFRYNHSKKRRGVIIKYSIHHVTFTTEAKCCVNVNEVPPKNGVKRSSFGTKIPHSFSIPFLKFWSFFSGFRDSITFLLYRTWKVDSVWLKEVVYIKLQFYKLQFHENSSIRILVQIGS